MRLRTVREEHDSRDLLTFYPLGDVHLGSSNCDKRLFRETIAEIKANPKARWGGMGDYCEWITKDDPRFASGGIDEEIVRIGNLDRIGDVYVDTLAEMLKPIADKCWFFGRGNHEGQFERRHGTNLCLRILGEWQRKELYTDWAALTKVEFGYHGRMRTWNIYHSHGWQGGRTQGAKVNEVRRLMAYIQADIYLQGHSHDRWAMPETRLEVSPDHDKLIARRVFVGHTGSFLRTLQHNHSGYAEEKGYPPTDLGTLRFLFHLNGQNSGPESKIEVIQ